jgi:hypothetical protein
MKIKQYIVTYNNSYQINEGLTSLFNAISDEELNLLEVYVINNHSTFRLNPEFEERVVVLHNTLRPDFSTGHLSRNWNQAIINGFKNLNSPDADIVITNQDDTRFEKNYISTLIKLHTTYNFIQFGYGDNFISYTPQAVKRIGMWDERFCGIGYQEADYLLRAYLYNKENSSMHDYSHGRVLNPVGDKIIDLIPPGYDRREPYHLKALNHHDYNKRLFTRKWNINPGRWGTSMDELKPLIESYILYPYFEADVETLREQQYLI